MRFRRSDRDRTKEKGVEAPSISTSVQRYGRGLAGGLMLSLPLLYTMETWWAGFLSRPERLLAMLLGSLALLTAYQAHAGFRDNQTRLGVLLDSLEVLGLALLLSAALLALLGQVDWQRPLTENMGQIVVEGCLVSFGISVGGSQLGENVEEKKDSPRWTRQQVTGACGAVLLASTVGPTEEIPMLAREMSWWQLLALCCLSIGLGTLILFLGEFLDPARHSAFTTVALVSLATYAVALLASAVILWSFGRFDSTTLDFAVRQVVVLAFPAALGAAAGEKLLE